ncbi:hypothetical protein T4B_2204 [Trichinella pseudospiralis]|uniref:Uncharacterized protein n=1 Tax=Trichinella pseudospiralis TaxID=6337 RepID=A0A0V1KGX1_TRIPS|nr:hypothetical protein T4B_2204 [Trichinella pseudospiralis]KRZ46348.1 hypothetical protein T4C_343 [Trichinella pseudospiralis]
MILSESLATLNYGCPENHYFCSVFHSTSMLWLLAYPQSYSYPKSMHLKLIRISISVKEVISHPIKI